MAGIDILDLVEATEVNETNDYLAIVDKSDTSQDITGSTKKITVKNLLSGLLDLFYPIGTIYETTSTDLDTTTKMANHFGGTWEAYGAGRVLVAKSADTEFDTIGETGGVKEVTLTSAQSGVPAHTARVNWQSAINKSAEKQPCRIHKQSHGAIGKTPLQTSLIKIPLCLS